MKNSRRNVIVIETLDGDFIFGVSEQFNMVDYSADIKHADEFQTVEEANKVLEWFNSKESRREYKASVKSYSYEIGKGFSGYAKNVTETI